LSTPGNKTMIFFAFNCGANTIFNHTSPRLRFILFQPAFIDSAAALTARTMFW
jgi:hypothetical protein